MLRLQTGSKMQMSRLLVALIIALTQCFSLTVFAEDSFDAANHAKRLKAIETELASVNGIQIAYKSIGNEDDPAVLMIMGLGGSHLLWDDGLPFGIASGGYRVILFDNRDVGGSQKFTDHGDPTIWWEFLKFQLGFDTNHAYDLSDMAADGIGLLDVLEIDEAHVIGASMGGMIAQVVAARYPDRVESLVSIMSSPWMFSSDLPQPDEQDNSFIEDAAEGDLEQADRLAQIGLHTDAFPRQIMAILASGDRISEVRTITAPTLVLHGEDDTLVKPEHGRLTAELIAGSHHITYAGMAHDMPEALLPALTADILAHLGDRD